MFRLPASKVSFVSTAVLMLVIVIAAACDSTGASSTATSGIPGTSGQASVSELTAQQILDLALEASAAVVSVQAQGEMLLYAGGQNGSLLTEENGLKRDWTIEWTAPDRIRSVVRSGVVTSGNDSKASYAETVEIGQQRFRRNSLDYSAWIELLKGTGEVLNTPASVMNEIVVDDLVEVVVSDDAVVYRITGKSGPEGVPVGSSQLHSDIRDTLFIDAESFRVLRHERVVSGLLTQDATARPSPTAGQAVIQTGSSRFETWLDFTYPDEPIVIESPREYAPLR